MSLVIVHYHIDCPHVVIRCEEEVWFCEHMNISDQRFVYYSSVTATVFHSILSPVFASRGDENLWHQ